MTVVEILEELGVELLREGHKHCRPGWVQMDCPWCKTSGKFHLGINLTTNYGNCWRCGGKPIAAVLVKAGMAYKAAEEAARGLDTDFSIAPLKTRSSLKEPGSRTPLMPAHRRYLNGRSFDPDEIARIWRVEGIGIAHRLSWRLYIPIIWQREKVSWTTRSIAPDAKQRYISASAEEESINHKEIVYGLDYCNHSVVIVEGPTDAWAIGPGAGALFGLAYSTAQVRKLVEIPHRYVCFDNTPDAQARAHELASQLSVFPGVTEIITLDADDPGSASKKELDLLRRAAKIVN